MVTKKDLVIAVLATFCLTVTLFMIIPTRSSSSSRQYDPWLDIDDNGVIDMTDIGLVALLYGTQGTPINKTALLLELQTRISELEKIVTVLNRTKLGKPDWNNTDWTSLPKGGEVIFTHNLNTTNVLVYMIGSKDSQDPYIHQLDYGGLHSGVYWTGAYWKNLTPTTITVHRHGDDNNWNYVRVFMWIIPEP